MSFLCPRLFNLLAISPGLVLVFFHIQWKSVGLFLLGAVPLGITGAFSSVTLPQDWVTRCIGTAILVFVLLRNRGVLDLTSKPYLMVAGGGLVGFLSGMIGSASPMGAAIFLSLGLTPAAYIASEGMTALVMHGVKIEVYQQFIALDKDMAACGFDGSDCNDGHLDSKTGRSLYFTNHFWKMDFSVADNNCALYDF